MAQGDGVDIVAEQHGVSGVFNGLRFFVLKKVPMRDHYLERIRNAGGSIVRLEKQAHLTIADSARKDCPPESTSYKFIDEALRTGVLPDHEGFRCCAGSGPARMIGDVAVQSKTTRTPFTKEDDRILLTYLKDVVRQGGRIGGNVPYQDIQEKYGRHPWQSWRSRYVDNLAKKHTIASFMAPDASDEQVVDGQATAGEHVNDTKRSAIFIERQAKMTTLLAARKPVDASGTAFTAEEIDELIGQLPDIPDISMAGWASAWEDWAQATENQHTAEDWKVLYTRHIKPVLQREGWSHALERVSLPPRKSITAQHRSIAAQGHKASPTTREPDVSNHNQHGQQSANEGRKRKLSAASEQTPRKRQAVPDASGKKPITSMSESRRSGSIQRASQTPRREKVDWAFDQALQRKHIEESAVTPQGTATTPSKHPLTAANLATQSQQQSLMPERSMIDLIGNSAVHEHDSAVPQSHTGSDQNHRKKRSQSGLFVSPDRDTRTNERRQDEQQPANEDQHHSSTAVDVDGQDEQSPDRDVQESPRLLDSHIPETYQETPGQAARSEASYDHELLSMNSDINEEISASAGGVDDDFEPDLTIPSPVKPLRLQQQEEQEERQESVREFEDSNSEENEASEARDEGYSGRQRICNTQAVLDAETQQVDFSLAMPSDHADSLALSVESDSDDQESSSDDASATHPSSLSDADQETLSYRHESQEINADVLEDFFEHFMAKGFPEEDIAAALHTTSARPDLAEFVLLLSREGKSIPDDMIGVWSAEDDEILTGSDSRKLSALEEKVGTEEFYIRLHFLEDYNDNSQE